MTWPRRKRVNPAHVDRSLVAEYIRRRHVVTKAVAHDGQPTLDQRRALLAAAVEVADDAARADVARRARHWRGR